MDSNQNYLITISNGEYLIEVALKTSGQMLTGDADKYPLEPENKKQFQDLLPQHCSSFGNIVEIKKLFEITDTTK